MSFLKRKSTIAVAVLLLAILIGSYGYMVYQQQLIKQQQQQTLEAKQKDFQKTITYVQHQVPRLVGYPLTYPSYNMIIVKETYETLVRYEGSSLDFKPSLAEKWEVSPDGKVFTFYLRQGVKFYPSGDPFNAAAVKFTFDTAFRRNPETTAPISFFGGLDWVMYDHSEIVNDYTVKIYINKPLSWFMRIVAFVQTGGIMNPKFINAHGGPPNTIDTIDPYLIWHQDVTGPYIVDEFAPNDRVILKRNPTWWGWNSTNANHPERFVVRVVPEAATRMMLIGRGDADIAYVDLQYLPELKKRIASDNLPLAMDESPSPALQDIVLDNLHSPTNDVHIRRMLAWSFNYDEYIKTIMSGFGNRLISFVPKGMWGYQPDVPYYTFNLDKAKQELDLATPGNRSMVQQGIKVQYTPGYALGKEGYLMWKSDLAKIGVNLILDELAYSTYRDVMHTGNIPILDRAWSPDFPDPATLCS
jgi:peptide/nickel transport system substrate-binding protein